MILAWNGVLSHIPNGWVLCDGSNGTPDLRGKFILGESSVHPMSQTGGEESHVLTVAEMPTHHHYWQIGYELIPANTNGEYSLSSAADIVEYAGGAWGSGVYPLQQTTDTGNNQPHNNMPPYYSLAYIMRK